MYYGVYMESDSFSLSSWQAVISRTFQQCKSQPAYLFCFTFLGFGCHVTVIMQSETVAVNYAGLHLFIVPLYYKIKIN